MTDRERIITAFEKCIRITKNGEMVSDCEHCPYKSKEWEKKGFAACDEFSELTVEVPWQLADDLLKLAKGQQEPQKPALGVAPYYVSAWQRIGELTEAIQRQYEQADGDPKLVDQWAKEIGWQCALIENMREDEEDA